MGLAETAGFVVAWLLMILLLLVFVWAGVRLLIATGFGALGWRCCCLVWVCLWLFGLVWLVIVVGGLLAGCCCVVCFSVVRLAGWLLGYCWRYS